MALDLSFNVIIVCQVDWKNVTSVKLVYNRYLVSKYIGTYQCEGRRFAGRYLGR